MYKLLICILFFIFGCSPTISNTDPKPASVIISNDASAPSLKKEKHSLLPTYFLGVDWLIFNTNTLAIAAHEQKYILLYIDEAYCSYCREMDLITFANLDVMSEINTNFIPVRIGSEEDWPQIVKSLKSMPNVEEPILVFLQVIEKNDSDIYQVNVLGYVDKFIPPKMLKSMLKVFRIHSEKMRKAQKI